MTKADLADTIANHFGLPHQQAAKIVEHVFGSIETWMVAGNEVSIVGFGTFSVRTRAARNGVNPQKPNKPMVIPEVRVPKFKAGSRLKKAIKAKG